MAKTTNRILVVDDDPDIGLMIKTMLEYNGYSVTLAGRPERVKDILKADYFNLLIMDMLLSGMNGTDICTELKCDKSMNTIAVIMISAHPNAREICLQAGADEFVSKPFDIHEMLSKIKLFITAA